MAEPEMGVAQAVAQLRGVAGVFDVMTADRHDHDHESAVQALDVLVARLATLEREREGLAKALRDADLLHLADEQSIRNLEREREALRDRLTEMTLVHHRTHETRDEVTISLCGLYLCREAMVLLAPSAPAGCPRHRGAPEPLCSHPECMASPAGGDTAP